jgi:hypothetical protein
MTISYSLSTARDYSPSRIGLHRLEPRRGLQWALGGLWLLDAGLQLQPSMFDVSFVTGTIEPTVSGAPHVVAAPVLWSANIMLGHLGLYNTVFALTQLALGVAMLSRRTVRPALAASVGWALLVWLFGEGLGGVLSGGSPLTGVPGGVVIYALVAVLVWPPRRSSAPHGHSPARSELAGSAARVLWTVLWASFCWYLLLPANRAPHGIVSAVAGSSPGEPAWVKGILGDLVSSPLRDGTEASLVLAGLCGLLAVGIWLPRTQKATLLAAGLFGVLCALCQAFGGVFTGSGTDPGSGPVLVLLAACYWPYRTHPLDAVHHRG